MKVVEEKHHVFITTGTEELDSIDGSTIDCNDGAPVSGKTAYSDSHPVTNETPYSDSHPVSGESTSYSDSRRIDLLFRTTSFVRYQPL